VRLAVIIVTHRCREALTETLPALTRELEPGDELIVVDNASGDGTAERARELAPGGRVLEAGANLGYGAGNNLGAEAATAELLCFLNPDAVPASGFREALAAPLRDGLAWGAWQGLVTAQGGTIVNTRGGAVHFTGIAWAGGAGERLEPPPSEPSTPEPGFVSGACLVIPRALFRELGGFAEELFLYHEDVDLSLRLRLAGHRLGVAAGARVDHDYEFDKGPAKWRFLERNRWATLIRTYPAPLLWLLAPALLATEAAVLAAAVAGGWAGPKLASWADLARWLPRLWRERQAIAHTRAVGSRQFAAALTPALDSPYLGGVARSRLVGAALRAYWAVVLALLGRR
jgi:GT2 family glycosyltransferase